MQKHLQLNNINFPDYWDLPKILNAFKTLSTLELYEYFGCPSATSFTRKMGKYMPNRPAKQSYAKYLLDSIQSVTETDIESVTEIVNVSEIETVSEIVPKKPKSLRQKMIEIYEKSKGSIFIDEYMNDEITKEIYCPCRKEWAETLKEGNSMK